MTALPAIAGWNLLSVVILMLCVWPFSLVRRDAGIVDIFWGLGFVLVAWLTFLHADGYPGRRLLVALLTTVWGFRLALHLAWRSSGEGEDRRYRKMRAAHGKNFWWVSLFTVFGLQAVLLWLGSLVIQAPQTAAGPARLTWLDAAGVIVWAFGVGFEALADLQLAAFKADPANRGAVMRSGLWAWSRHPNYFGEMLVWWGFYLVALSSPRNAWTIISPLIMTFLLLKVSGVSLMEKDIGDTRPGYPEYARTTNAFWPWFPKRER